MPAPKYSRATLQEFSENERWGWSLVIASSGHLSKACTSFLSSKIEAKIKKESGSPVEMLTVVASSPQVPVKIYIFVLRICSAQLPLSCLSHYDRGGGWSEQNKIGRISQR